MSSRESRRYRIAIVTPYFYPIVGGITTFVDGLTNELTARGFEVRIWTRYGDATASVERGPESPLRFQNWARARIRAWNPDVVHAHSHWYTLASAFGVCGPIAPVTVFTVHTEVPRNLGTVRRYLLSRLMTRADVVTAVSRSTVEELRVRFPGIRRLEFVPPGVRDLQVDDSAVPWNSDLRLFRNSFPRLCSLGMMVWRDKVRGMEVLVRSMPTVLRLFPSAKLLFVGSGPGRVTLEAVARAEGVERAVLFVGEQSKPASFVKACDLVLHCSFQDAFPQAILESLALGLPVVSNQEVATKLSKDSESLGILSVPATPEQFANAVYLLASNDRLRRELARRGAVVRQAFSWAKTVDHFVGLYGIVEP